MLALPPFGVDGQLDEEKPEKGTYRLAELRVNKLDIAPDNMRMEVGGEQVWLQMPNTSMATNDFNFAYERLKFPKASDDTTISCGMSHSVQSTPSTPPLCLSASLPCSLRPLSCALFFMRCNGATILGRAPRPQMITTQFKVSTSPKVSHGLQLQSRWIIPTAAVS